MLLFGLSALSVVCSTGPDRTGLERGGRRSGSGGIEVRVDRRRKRRSQSGGGDFLQPPPLGQRGAAHRLQNRGHVPAQRQVRGRHRSLKEEDTKTD